MKQAFTLLVDEQKVLKYNKNTEKRAPSYLG